MPSWLDRLAAAADLYAQCDETKLAGMYHAVGAAVERLRQSPEARQHLEPLIALQVQLDKLNNGRRVSTLRRRDRVQLDGHLGMIQSVAICISDVLFHATGRKHGSRGRADQEAALVLCNHGLVGFQGSRITGDMVRQWRSQHAGHEAPQVNEFRRKLPADLSMEGAIAVANELAARAAAHPH